MILAHPVFPARAVASATKPGRGGGEKISGKAKYRYL